MLKYQEHLILYPNCKYSCIVNGVNDKNNIWYENFNDAVNNAKPSYYYYRRKFLNCRSSKKRDKYITICIYNPNATDMIPNDWIGTGWDSMNLLQYAKYRFVYIDLKKSIIFGEECSIYHENDESWSSELYYDYNLLFGPKGYAKQFKTIDYDGNNVFALMPSRVINGIHYRYSSIEEYMNSRFTSMDEKIFACYIRFDLYFHDEDEFIIKTRNIKKRFPIRNKTVPYKK